MLHGVGNVCCTGKDGLDVWIRYALYIHSLFLTLSLTLFLTIYLYPSLSFSLPIYLYPSLSFSLSIYLHLSLSIYLSLFLNHNGILTQSNCIDVSHTPHTLLILFSHSFSVYFFLFFFCRIIYL